jgi:membrane-bound serine protease (ClpP class)
MEAEVKERSLMAHDRLAKILIGMLALAGLLLASTRWVPEARAQAGNPEVVVLEATGPVVPPLAGYIARGLGEADALNAEAVILMLDTPGGQVTTTWEIVQDIRGSDVPVIVFVGPAGANAASAGLLITLAGHAAAMAPDTAIGASSPVGGQGEDLPSTSQEKAEQYLSAQARSLAERRGEQAVAVANEAVTQARAVSASEALEVGLVDFIAVDVMDLLGQLDGFLVEINGQQHALNTEDAVPVSVPMTQLERILMLLTDPNVVFFLLSVGPIAIIVEIRSPGGWVAGAFGTVCLGLALYGLGVLPVNWLGIVFVILAFVLFVLEIKAPVHGALTATGIVSLAAGGVILFNQPEVAPFGSLSIPLVVGQSVLLGGLFIFLAVMALRAQKRQPATGYEGLIGQIGRVTQDVDPVGIVLVWGERWQAESVDGQPISTGERVEVVEAGQMLLRVRRVSGQDRRPPAGSLR